MSEATSALLLGELLPVALYLAGWLTGEARCALTRRHRG